MDSIARARQHPAVVRRVLLTIFVPAALVYAVAWRLGSEMANACYLARLEAGMVIDTAKEIWRK
jgi:hypothetical protein